jgi:hypothetical protein
MKKVLSISLLITAIAIISCGQSGHKGKKVEESAADTGKAAIVFNAYEHDFGQVKEGEKVACFFTFTNTGTSNLVVNSAVASCGCTVPKFSGKPVAPGKTGSIEVKFDTTDRSGKQTKTITVKSNATTPVVLLKITTEVINSNN